MSGTSLSRVSASCSFGRFEIPPDHVRLVFATFVVNLKFTSKLNRCILKKFIFSKLEVSDQIHLVIRGPIIVWRLGGLRPLWESDCENFPIFVAVCG